MVISEVISNFFKQSITYRQTCCYRYKEEIKIKLKHTHSGTRIEIETT